MLQQADIISFLRQHQSLLKQEFGVEKIGLFGSYARTHKGGTQHDIDFLVRFNEPDFLKWSGLLNYLQQSFNCKIDLITEGPHLSQAFNKLIEKDVIYA